MLKVILDNSQAQKARMAHQKSEVIEIHKNYGKVPKYINKYNQQREDDHIR